MKKELVTQLHNAFECIMQKDKEIEFWYARDLQNQLGYDEWRNFILVVDKAKISCKTSKNPEKHHFVDVNKMIPLGNGGQRKVDDIKLSRYACYLIAQNGDSRKSEKILSGVLFERGVDAKGFARIRSKGDEALFGGKNTQKMKDKLAVPENRPLADFLPTITIKAKDFSNEITTFNTTRDNLKGEPSISKEHVKNNANVRKLLTQQNIYPEKLPPAEDVKKIGRKIKLEGKNLGKIISSNENA